MIEYEICQLSNDHHMKVMKCTADASKINTSIGNKKGKTLILIIPGIKNLFLLCLVIFVSKLYF
jgi:hypothetical protein